MLILGVPSYYSLEREPVRSNITANGSEVTFIEMPNVSYFSMLCYIKVRRILCSVVFLTEIRNVCISHIGWKSNCNNVRTSASQLSSIQHGLVESYIMADSC